MGVARELLRAESAAVEIDGAALLSPTSLRAEAGECIAVVGHNGAGKATLLRALAGRARVTAGSVQLRGHAIDERRREVRREIAALIDPPTLYPDLTLRENLALVEAAWSGELMSRQGSPLVPGLGAEALETFGLQSLESRFAHELSSGQRQLTSLAVTFARPANVLLLDEPEQRLDAERRGIVAEAMRAARARGVSIVFASHSPDMIDRAADRRVVLGETAE